MRDNFVEITTAIIIVFTLIFTLIFNYTNSEDRIIHIKSITTISDSSKTKYKIFAKEGVFENSDRFFILKFNSSDLQNKLIGQKICKVHTMGYRIPFFSEYPDITKIYWCKSSEDNTKAK